MSPKLQRQIIVFVALVGLSIPYRVIAGPMSGEAFGGLIFLIFLAGVGINHLFDEGYKFWQVVVIGVSMFFSVGLFFGLMRESYILAVSTSFLVGLPAGLTMYFGGRRHKRPEPE